jgi:hypothetical protein
VEINALLPAIEVRSGPHHIASHHHNGAGASRARFEASHRLLPSSTITGARQVLSNSAAGCFCQHHHEYSTFDSTSSLPCPCPALPASHPPCLLPPSHEAANPASPALGRIRLGPFASCGPNTGAVLSLLFTPSLLASLSLHPSLHTAPSLFLSLSSRLHPLSLE